MSAIVFAGPTLLTDEIKQFISADCKPPAAQGDIYRAATERPECIGIIDGYFNGVPSVWHKEILWAMDQGIAVFGSASMGALRAAELCAFGMVGVGQIFEDYKAGIIEDDDEVAVIHAPEELGFKALSTPLVNIRATLNKATTNKILSPKVSNVLLGKAKDLFYQERNWETILKGLPKEYMNKEELDNFSRWLSENQIDLKKEDAISMLKAMDTHIKSGEKIPIAHYEFEHTHLWERLISETDIPVKSALGDQEEAQVLDELRLDKDRFDAIWAKAAYRSLSLQEFEGQAIEAERAQVRAHISTHMQEHGLHTRKALVRWIEKNGMSISQFENLFTEETMAENTTGLSIDHLTHHALQVIKRDGFYAALAKRARSKHKNSTHRTEHPSPPQSIGLTPPELMTWYFNTQCGVAVPDDLKKYISSLGLDTLQQFYAIVSREYRYIQEISEE